MDASGLTDLRQLSSRTRQHTAAPQTIEMDNACGQCTRARATMPEPALKLTKQRDTPNGDEHLIHISILYSKHTPPTHTQGNIVNNCIYIHFARTDTHSIERRRRRQVFAYIYISSRILYARHVAPFVRKFGDEWDPGIVECVWMCLAHQEGWRRCVSTCVCVRFVGDENQQI